MIQRAKRFEIDKKKIMINFSIFGSNIFLTLKIVDFENVTLTKSCSYLCDKGHIYNQILVKNIYI
jgi:hypothetical protein